MSTTVGRKVAISGPGLKKEGIIVLQFFFIGIFSYLELLLRNGFGILTGLVIMLVPLAVFNMVAMALATWQRLTHHLLLLPLPLLS